MDSTILHTQASTESTMFEGTSYINGLKRWIDVVLSSFLIILFLPLIVVISLAIALTSRGPIILVQPRVGWGGGLFRCYKFRTMYSAKRNEEIEKEARRLAAQGILYKPERDPRITPVGHWLRRASLDELPQLFNVLKGDMSMVGPRPLVELMLQHHIAERQLRSVLRPGITGLWQVRARQHSTSVLQMMPHDVEYIQTVSLKNDLKILASTIPAVLLAKGAK